MLFDQIASNKRKTWILLLVFFLLLALVGYAVGYLFMRSGLGGMIIALIIGFVYALTMIFQSTEIVMSMNGAREVDEQTAPDLYHVVEDMAMVAQIPMPRVFFFKCLCNRFESAECSSSSHFGSSSYHESRGTGSCYGA